MSILFVVTKKVMEKNKEKQRLRSAIPTHERLQSSAETFGVKGTDRFYEFTRWKVHKCFHWCALPFAISPTREQSTQTTNTVRAGLFQQERNFQRDSAFAGEDAFRRLRLQTTFRVLVVAPPLQNSPCR